MVLQENQSEKRAASFLDLKRTFCRLFKYFPLNRMKHKVSNNYYKI